ncbi:uncharacterized protein LOC107636065 [Arachis ipaensis]|uniref:uncharacterized protein LOC107636065 n=1 Tax=Arachis ipaensis TaxID=130454 RepID=UPI0007AFA43E|nr:uncharacterized protein LOC107636065 [Arachis ipaensis]XP_025647288.1 uncharacterized protein LOC112742265 [Arachis hypogaea]
MITALSMEIGDGRRTHFWEDIWLSGGALKDRFPRLFSVSIQKGSVIGVYGFWDGLEWVWNFQWRRELFQWELELVNQLHDTLRPVEMLPDNVTSYSFTKTVWRGLVPPRVELFAWFVLIGRVNTKEILGRLGIINPNDNVCLLCNKDVELVHHLFLGCDFTWQVWCAWVSDFDRQWSFPGTVKEHFLSWTGVTSRKEERKKWFISFFAVIWNIWLERNKKLFQSTAKGVDELINLTALSYKEWESQDPFSC